MYIGNEKIEGILDENRQLRLINDNYEVQVRECQQEIAEFDSNEEKYLQQVKETKIFIIFFSKRVLNFLEKK